MAFLTWISQSHDKKIQLCILKLTLHCRITGILDNDILLDFDILHSSLQSLQL